MNKHNKSNNKGFTLLELLISISIFTIVIFMGYSLINKYNVSVNEQSNITQNQLSTNSLNNFITKDLEQAQGITLKCIDPNETYIYSIKNNEESKDENYLENALNEITERNKIISSKEENKLTYAYRIDKLDESKSPSYTVDMKYNKNNSYIEYSIYRSLPGEGNIEIINNKVKKEGDLFPNPIAITKSNPYFVIIENKDDKGKLNVNEFQVASRYITGNSNGGSVNPEIPKPPTIDEIPDIPGFNGEYDSIGFWTADKTKCPKVGTEYIDSLYTWVNDAGVFGRQNERNKFEFDILADTSNGNAEKADSKIGYNTSDWKAEVKDGKFTRAKKTDTIMIYISPDTTLKSTEIIFNNGNKGTFKSIISIDNEEMLNPNNGKYILEGGKIGTWYKVDFEKGQTMTCFNVVGKLEMNSTGLYSSGYAVVYVGSNNEENTQIQEDIIYNLKNENNRFYVEGKSNIGNDTSIHKNQNASNNPANMNIEILKHEPAIRVRGLESEIVIKTNYKKDIEDIIGLKFKVNGGIVLQNIKTKIDNNETIYTDLKITQSQNSYIFDIPKDKKSKILLSGSFVFDNLKNSGDTSKLAIELIYK
ncbi:prepilin-type N-terminal cleavage/methylation domain-containing protein [Romboutsia sp.]|uniref:prepilin-type N-terminal cleavage/methylation domain-containing protein n=1 Tax=Romboutsia sp. TaxID=1965302 RepID=UPI003F40FDF5